MLPSMMLKDCDPWPKLGKLTMPLRPTRNISCSRFGFVVLQRGGGASATESQIECVVLQICLPESVF